jgi:hypothetical protein
MMDMENLLIGFPLRGVKGSAIMVYEAKGAIDKQVAAHRAKEKEDIVRLRSLSMKERSVLLEAACEAATEILRSRLAAGLPLPQRDPWPESTWEFLRKHAARVRS